jgi:hypothetical protein
MLELVYNLSAGLVVWTMRRAVTAADEPRDDSESGGQRDIGDSSGPHHTFCYRRRPPSSPSARVSNTRPARLYYEATFLNYVCAVKTTQLFMRIGTGLAFIVISTRTAYNNSLGPLP